MAKSKFNRTSPYYTTKLYGKFLDVMANRDIPAMPDDVSYTISKVYEHRPDLLAYDMYGDASLWWVFTQRNPNVLQNPIVDFSVGRTIRIPKKQTVFRALGL